MASILVGSDSIKVHFFSCHTILRCPEPLLRLLVPPKLTCREKKNHRHVVAAKTVDYVECLICMPTKKMCTQKLAKDSNGFQPDLCSNSPFEKQLSATKKTMENSCNIQTDRILNGGILSLSVGFSTKFPHSSRMVSTNTKSKDGHFAYTYKKELGVHTTETYSYSKRENSSIYIIYVHTSQAIFASKLKWNQPPTPENRNTTSTNSNPNVATKSNSKKKTKTKHHPTSKHQNRIWRTETSTKIGRLKVTGSSQRVRRSRCCGLTKTKSCLIVMPVGWWSRDGVSPWNLTWNLKMMVWKMIFLFSWVLFRFHVKFQGCIMVQRKMDPLKMRKLSSKGLFFCTEPWLFEKNKFSSLVVNGCFWFL